YGRLIESDVGCLFSSSLMNMRSRELTAGAVISVTGTGLTNNGTILVDTTAANVTTTLRFDADGTLGGNGSVTLNGITSVFNVAGSEDRHVAETYGVRRTTYAERTNSRSRGGTLHHK